MEMVHKILIVEDEFLIALYLKTQLSKMGYQIGELASTGENALQIVRQTPPDLVLMDINLAGAMSGLVAAQAIHAQYNTPIIFMTGLIDEDTLEQARQISPLACLMKPIHPTDIQAAIKSYERTLGE
jgi:CheY-like chemotaxis protein